MLMVYQSRSCAPPFLSIQSQAEIHTSYLQPQLACFSRVCVRGEVLGSYLLSPPTPLLLSSDANGVPVTELCPAPACPTPGRDASGLLQPVAPTADAPGSRRVSFLFDSRRPSQTEYKNTTRRWVLSAARLRRRARAN